jgi:hypothetical protein
MRTVLPHRPAKSSLMGWFTIAFTVISACFWAFCAICAKIKKLFLFDLLSSTDKLFRELVGDLILIPDKNICTVGKFG